MRKPVRSHSEPGERNKVVNLERWRLTGDSESDTIGSPGGESPSGPLAARALDWRQAIAQMSRKEKQAVLLMFILAPATSEDQLDALLWATGLGTIEP